MELTKNNMCHSQLSYNNTCKVTYLNWKANSKDHTEEALHNLSCDMIVYVLFVSICRFHETCHLNKMVSMPDLVVLFICNFI